MTRNGGLAASPGSTTRGWHPVLVFALRRFGAGVLLVFLVASATFALVSLAPGDIASRLSDPRIPPAARERWRQHFGLDRPWPLRYGQWLAAAAEGDFGTSWLHHREVSAVLGDALPKTLLLTSVGLFLELVGGIALALAQTRRPHGLADRTITVATLAAYAMPTFMVALGLVYLFSFRLGLFPASHLLSPEGEMATGWRRLADLLHHLVLPALAVGIAGAGAVARYVRGSLLDERTQGYIVAARARGCSLWRATLVHALPNALLPLITMIGLSIPFLVSGSLVIEVVFAWPGMGQVMYNAALARDVPLLMGGTVVATVAVVVGNLVADLAYAAADPRVRL